MKKLLLHRRGGRNTSEEDAVTKLGIIGAFDYFFGISVLMDDIEGSIPLYLGTKDSPVIYHQYDWYVGDNYDIFLFGNFPSNILSLVKIYVNGEEQPSSVASLSNIAAQENDAFTKFDCIDFYVPVNLGQKNVIEIKDTSGRLLHNVIVYIYEDSGNSSVSGPIATIIKLLKSLQCQIKTETLTNGTVVLKTGIDVENKEWNILFSPSLKKEDKVRIKGQVYDNGSISDFDGTTTIHTDSINPTEFESISYNFFVTLEHDIPTPNYFRLWSMEENYGIYILRDNLSIWVNDQEATLI